MATLATVLPAFLSCAAAAACLLRFVATLRTMPAAAPGTGLPWWLRWTWRPAAPLAGPCGRLWPARWRTLLRRRLVAVGSGPLPTPQHWLAMTLVLAATCATTAGMACWSSGLSPVAGAVVAAVAGGLLPEAWLARRLARHRRDILRELPSYLDLLTLGVEAGAALAAAVRLIVERAAPSPLRAYFDRVLREIRGGRTRAEAFAIAADAHAVPELAALATALAHGESTGMSLGSILRAQGAQRTAERFATAERLAMQAPVKLLGPLILCIFPCTFIVLAVPVLVRLREAFLP